jgi:serralysin
VVTVGATGNAEIDGLLFGTKWSGTITYSFPNSANNYVAGYGDGEPLNGFAQTQTQMQQAIAYAVALISSYTNISFQFAGTGSADMQIARSSAANPTSYAYYPWGGGPEGGDIWFGTQYDYSQAKLGNYYFATALHELGHSLGLKHSQENGGVANVSVPFAHDALEYTIMSYRSYVGGSTNGGYTNEAFGYPQTYMANDILALQTLYGADYATQNGNTVYTWSPTTGQLFINSVGQLAPGSGSGGSANRIFMTIWDGGGIDTYDLSNYSMNLTINLNPGNSSTFSTVQLAYLGDGHYASGNVYNSYLFNNNPASYIENVIGGAGNDTIIGNPIVNELTGGAGNDMLTGGAGNDVIDGEAGTDTAVFSGNYANYTISYNSGNSTFTIADTRSGSPDGIDSLVNVEKFKFADTIVDASYTTPAVTTVIESNGSTSLTEIANHYYFYDSTGSGPSLKYGSADIVAGQFGTWAPIGVEKTASGYEVAWRDASSGQYSVWNTDSNGNYVSNVTGIVSGTNATLESLETSFHQDLNGDGQIGAPTTVIESAGVTSLTEIANHYYFYDSTGSGPSLKYGSADIVAGQFGTWAPIGVEKTASGYEVAWRDASSGQYSVWNTDSNGNYVSNVTGIVSGTNATLESLETSFHQDLNGDGQIGLPATVLSTTAIESAGATSLTELDNDTFRFKPTVSADVTGNAASADSFLSTTHSDQLQSVLNDIQRSQSHSLLEGAGNDTVTHLASNDVVTPTNVAVMELHAGTFIIH